MKFYRVHILIECGVSTGYEFFTSKAGAKRAISEWKACKHADENGIAEIDVIEIAPTKADILRALNTFAAHENNG